LQSAKISDPSCSKILFGKSGNDVGVEVMPYLVEGIDKGRDAIFEEIVPMISDKKTKWIILD